MLFLFQDFSNVVTPTPTPTVSPLLRELPVSFIESQITPAIAHRMHQNQHNHQQQNQEEIRRNRFEERRKLQTEERKIKEQKKIEIGLQEKRREDERALQQKFEIEFEQEQKKLQQQDKNLRTEQEWPYKKITCLIAKTHQPSILHSSKTRRYEGCAYIGSI